MYKCKICGTVPEEGATFCACCGTPVPPIEEDEEKGKKVPSPFIAAFAGNLFLSVCILATIATVMSFGLTQILFTVFCWIIYYNAKNGKLNMPIMRAVSGTVYASRIIYFSVAVILLVCAGIVMLCALIIPPEIVDKISEMYEELMAILQQEGIPQYAMDIVTSLLGYGIKKLLGFLAGFLAGMGGYFLILGFIWGGIHKFTKELYTKLQIDEKEFAYAEKGASSLMASGVIMAIFAIFEASISFASTVPSLLFAAAMIVGFVFVKKTFISQCQ